MGGTGLIGSKLVARLRTDGHEPLAASRRSGVNALTGDGLATALDGAQVVVDVSGVPAGDDAATLDFFRTSSRNLLAAEAAARVRHHVMLSLVGADRLQGSGYFRAKVAQEEAVKGGPVPYTILRAAPSYESIGRVAESVADGATVRLPAALHPARGGRRRRERSGRYRARLTPGRHRRAGRPGSVLPRRARPAHPQRERPPARSYDGRSCPLLRRRARPPVPHRRRRRAHRPHPLRRLAPPVSHDPHISFLNHQSRKDLPCHPPSFSSTAPSPSRRAGTRSSICCSTPVTR